MAFPKAIGASLLLSFGEGTESLAAKRNAESPAIGEQLTEEVCERENCKQALARVKANKGSPGVEGMTVHDLPGFLKQHWPAIREQLLSGTYTPQPVRRVARYLRGWIGYFGNCETPRVLERLEEWTRRRLRAAIWKQWKRRTKRFAELRKRGVSKDLTATTAGSAHGPGSWRTARPLRSRCPPPTLLRSGFRP